MSIDPFRRLAPFIREYIYTHGWTEMRPVQVEACKVIFETNAHLLLSSGTASGKTEAAFLPAITLMHEDPSSTIGILYIGPLKALINDQFVRLQDLLTEADIPVWRWHGDVSQDRKKKLLNDPRGILQITPESMESLFINKTVMLPNMFGDLRFVIIDEVHAFMGSDRGRQVLCQLDRLSSFLHAPVRRIGLSATLGDYAQAEEWLRSGTDRPVVTPAVRLGGQRIRIAVENFYIGDDGPSQIGKTDRKATLDAKSRANKSLDEYVFDSSRGKKCLIFANDRGQTESIVASMRSIAEARGLPDIYHVHHGSISASLREAAENAMRGWRPAVTAATVTLELGIDIGLLERVIQLQSPPSVSSFVQRLGRSGRRGSPAEMWFALSEHNLTGKENLPRMIPWRLLQCIAIIQLYLEEQWIEPVRSVKYPFSLLYHQTMSTLASCGELVPALLAGRVLSLSPFKCISADDLRELLLHLIEIDHVQKTDEGGLIVGLEGERIVRDFRFYAVFPDNEEYTVKEKSTEIGSIVMPPPPGERFGLAGRTWEVVEIDARRKVVYAVRVKGKVTAVWHGGTGDVHTRILQKMREILFEDTGYAYLQAGACERLRQVRILARHSLLDQETIVPLGGNSYCIFPWLGTIGFRTLERCLSQPVFSEWLSIKDPCTPYFMIIDIRKGTPSDIINQVISFGETVPATSLVKPDEAPQLQKYDPFVPPNLLLKAYCSDYLDLRELKNLAGAHHDT